MNGRVKLVRADAGKLAREVAHLYDLIEHAVDGRNALWRLRNLIEGIERAERYIAAHPERFEVVAPKDAKALETV
jgi:hypothetical protein